MIVLTVKTLDSQNHSFTVDDNITVEEFKVKIADTVNIPAETQRIIYCGRVLQDNAKLGDYDVNGKVVHLVQRPPPSAQTRNRSPSPPQPQRRGFRGFEHGNTMYLGSMAFPSNLMETQGITPPPPTHSLSGSRLNVAKKMLKKAEAVIRILENLSNRRNEPMPQEEQQEEEVTPIIEARVIVPNLDRDNVDQGVVISAVQNAIFNAEMSPNGLLGSVPGSSDSAPPEEGSASTPEDPTPINASTENLSSESSQERPTRRRTAIRTTEMANLLTMLNQLQARFAPFLERYLNFMNEDPSVEPENVAHMQTMLTRTSEVLHFLSHAYHSLSDIMVRVRAPPPRLLLCRPILIQHSAVVQAGIPIQFEVAAQFSLPNDNNSTSTTSSNAGPTSSTENTTTTSTTTTTTSSNTTPMLRLPLIPGSVHVQPMPFRFLSASNLDGQRSQNNNNTVGGSNQTGGTASATAGGVGFGPEFNPSNVEFSMEVTPEVMRDNPPELLQSIMQMANQYMAMATGAVPRTSDATATTNTTSQSTESTSESPTSGQQTTPGQNSQARGNTQTNPTTATHTRSTSRPHVHLAQQGMQGFDPFLPCNSHHLTSRRHSRTSASNQQQQPRGQRSSGGQQENISASQQNTVNQALSSVVQGLMNVIRNTAFPTDVPSQPSNAPRTMTETTGGGANTSQIPTDSRMAQLLSFLPSDDVATGESLITDLIMVFSTNLRIVDMFNIHAGNLDPLNRITDEIRIFFTNRVLGGSTTEESIETGVSRIIYEMRPFFENFSRLNVRDDINIVRSIELLFTARLPTVVTIAANLEPQNVRQFVDECMKIAQYMCAIALHASVNGRQGVQEMFHEIMGTYTHGMPVELRNWVIRTINTNLQQFITNLSVLNNDIEPYIVIRNDLRMPTTPTGTTPEPIQVDNFDIEPMELDQQVATTSESATHPNSLMVDEPLTNIVLGSETWHGQVPEEWVPIITRDVQKQRRQNTQQAFSDAYLSGMPSKRRKLLNNAKPQGSLPHVISETLKRAVTATGLTSVTPLDRVTQAVGNSLEVQNAYRSLLRTTVQGNLRGNEDFTPERFPNASIYFGEQ